MHAYVMIVSVMGSIELVIIKRFMSSDYLFIFISVFLLLIILFFYFVLLKFHRSQKFELFYLDQNVYFVFLLEKNVRNINPRPAGVWLVTRPAGGGGGGQRAPP